MTTIPPFETFCVIVLVTLFVVLLLGWWCRTCSKFKSTEVRTARGPSNVLRGVDVRTGRPVLVHRSTLSQPSSQMNSPLITCPEYPHGFRGYTLYGTMICDPPVTIPGASSRRANGAAVHHGLPRTPPPPYSELFPSETS